MSCSSLTRPRLTALVTSSPETVKPSPSDDRELMGQVRGGSLEAFAEFYDRFCDRAYRVAFSVCRDEGPAEDAVQEAFLSIWRSRASHRPHQGTIAAWVLTVVRHCAIDLVRRDGPRAAQSGSDDRREGRTAPDEVGEEILQRDDANRLRASLARLPEAQQEAILLAYFGQLSHTEIATQLGLPAGTVKGRMRLGLRKLRADLKDAAA